jgi:uncharacterized membrane-anchored protein
MSRLLTFLFIFLGISLGVVSLADAAGVLP